MIDFAAARLVILFIVPLNRWSSELDDDIHRIIATSCQVAGDLLIAGCGRYRERQDQVSTALLMFCIPTFENRLASLIICSLALFPCCFTRALFPLLLSFLR